jgi:hypothetical protein
LEPFKVNGFQPTAVYWVMGEAPRGITASRLRGMHLIVFKKGEAQSTLHVVQTEPLNSAIKYFNLDKKIERRACETLLTALKEVFAL